MTFPEHLLLADMEAIVGVLAEAGICSMLCMVTRPGGKLALSHR
jgi:hypothetical protein